MVVLNDKSGNFSTGFPVMNILMKGLTEREAREVLYTKVLDVKESKKTIPHPYGPKEMNIREVVFEYKDTKVRLSSDSTNEDIYCIPYLAK